MTFKCSWLENMISIETDGYTRPCCGEPSKLARISDIRNGISTAFNHPKLLKLREDLETGFNEKTRYACSRCEHLESKGESSLRTNTRLLSEKRELKLLQFKMSNRCQLTCAHCGPDLSSGWAKLLNISPHVTESFTVTDDFLNELAEIIPTLEVIKFTGGEPFLDPNHWKILEFLSNVDTRHCTLFYITNGISKPRTELWQGWKEVKCSVSADGFEETYNWFRRGSDWDELVEGVDYLSKKSNVEINYAITPYTISSYRKAKDFWKYNFFPYSVVNPATASILNFPKTFVEKIDNYQTIPFSNSSSNTGDINFYRNWARYWDKQWNTEGWAEELFFWMKDEISKI